MSRLPRAALPFVLVAAGCGRAPRFEAAQGAPAPTPYLRAGPSYWDVGLERADETGAYGADDEPDSSRFAAGQLAPGAGFASETPAGVEFLEWLFDEEAPFDVELYLEYLRAMSFADVLGAALASFKIPLGRNTTAELSIGLNAAGGLELRGGGSALPEGDGPGEWPQESTEEPADVFDQLESVFVGLDIPLPGSVRSRLAVDLYYGWEAEVDPDAPEIEPLIWTLNVKYRVWFW